MLMWEFGHTTGWKTTWFSTWSQLSRVWVRISPTSDPIFLLAPLFFNSFSKSRRKLPATLQSLLFVPDDDEKNPANSEVHFASNSSGLLLLHFFNIFSNFFLSPLFRDHRVIENNSKRLILTTSELRLLSVNYLEYSRLPQLFFNSKL